AGARRTRDARHLRCAGKTGHHAARRANAGGRDRRDMEWTRRPRLGRGIRALFLPAHVGQADAHTKKDSTEIETREHSTKDRRATSAGLCIVRFSPTWKLSLELRMCFGRSQQYGRARLKLHVTAFCNLGGQSSTFPLRLSRGPCPAKNMAVSLMKKPHRSELTHLDASAKPSARFMLGSIELPGVDEPDFQALFRHLPGIFVVTRPDFTIFAASDDLLRKTLTWREDITGRGIFDVLPGNPSEPGGQQALEASLRDVSSHGV